MQGLTARGEKGDGLKIQMRKIAQENLATPSHDRDTDDLLDQQVSS